jgi:hypothetical protein
VNWDTFWGFIWIFLVGYAFIAYLMVLFSIISDLIRDSSLNGWFKVLWFIAIFSVPFLTALVYLLARGRGMAERQLAAAQANKDAADNYIKSVAGGSPLNEIAKAKELLDAGAITKAEFDALKKKQLA